MTTLRRELIQTIKDTITALDRDGMHLEFSIECIYHEDEVAETIADAVLALRSKRGSEAWKEAKREELAKKADATWKLGHGEEIEQEEIDENVLIQSALNTFETDMNCPKNWSWFHKGSEDKVWKELRDFVVERYREDPKCFQTYQTWRTQPFARGAMSNVAIKRRPEDFQASWSDFLASNAMYGKPEPSSSEPTDEIYI